MYWIKVPVQTSDPQTSDFTKVGQYKRRTYKRRTGTNVGQLQTSDWDKCRNSTHVRRVHLLGKTSDFGWISKKDHCYKKQIKNHSIIVIKIKDN